MDHLNAGFQEIEHTADWALRVWAPDLAGLFIQAATGMNVLMEVMLEPVIRQEQQLSLSAADDETLLVTFLEEILFFTEQDDIGF